MVWTLPISRDDDSVELRCPYEGGTLHQVDGSLICPNGHRHFVVDGVPVLLRDDVPETIGLIKSSLAAVHQPEEAPLYLGSVGISKDERMRAQDLSRSSRPRIDPVVAVLVGATSGHAYRHLIGKLDEYPIPEIHLPGSAGERLLDLGCSWGRWSMAAARKGYRVTGIDPSLGAVLAGKRASRQLGLDIEFICADARYLPFAPGSFDVAYSYSVVQHFSEADVERVLDEVSRVLAPGGYSVIQMAHHGGPLSLYHQMRRGFRSPKEFEVRYWRLSQLQRTFQERIGPTQIEAHSFFGLGIERSDAHLLRRTARVAATISERICWLSRRANPLLGLTDSVYVKSSKPVGA